MHFADLEMEKNPTDPLTKSKSHYKVMNWT